MDTNARTTTRSAASPQVAESAVIAVVTPPRGAQTRHHSRPLLTRASGTPSARHAAAARSTGVAAQSSLATRPRGSTLASST